MSRQQLATAMLLLITCCLLGGCAASQNLLKDSPSPDGSVAGFWLGLWHGMILPISFVVSLFRDGVNVYEVHNNGGGTTLVSSGVRLLCWAEVVPLVKQRESRRNPDLV